MFRRVQEFIRGLVEDTKNLFNRLLLVFKRLESISEIDEKLELILAQLTLIREQGDEMARRISEDLSALEAEIANLDAIVSQAVAEIAALRAEAEVSDEDAARLSAVTDAVRASVADLTAAIAPETEPV